MKINVYTRPKDIIYSLAIAAIIFDAYYLTMAKLPGNTNQPACIIGGALNAENLIFSGVLSLISAAVLIGLYKIYKRRSANRIKVTSLFGISSFFAFITVFCAVCTIPIITVFGFAFTLGFLTTYNAIIKISSLILMLVALYLVNKQLK